MMTFTTPMANAVRTTAWALLGRHPEWHEMVRVYLRLIRKVTV